jgi:hypothetical protein
MSGAKQSLGRTDYLMTEFSPGMMKEIKHNPMDYIDYIKTFGFTPWIINEKGLSEPDFDEIIRSNTQVNLFCSKENYPYLKCPCRYKIYFIVNEN